MAHKSLSDINVPFWLDFGTLLGVVREGDFIANDMDVDVSVLIGNYTDEIPKSMIRNGFVLKKEYFIDNKKTGFEQTYSYNGIGFDIFYHYPHEEGFTKTHCFVPFEKHETIDKSLKKGEFLPIEQYFPYLGFKKINFLGLRFNIPKKEHKYLEYHYGKDYLKPKSNWNFSDLERDNLNAKFLYNKVGILKKY